MVNGATPIWNAAGQLIVNPNIANTFTWTAFTSTNANYNFSAGGHESFNVDGNNGGFEQEAGFGGSPFQTTTIPVQTLSDENLYDGRIEYFLASDLSQPTSTSYDVAGYQTLNSFAVLPWRRPWSVPSLCVRVLRARHEARPSG